MARPRKERKCREFEGDRVFKPRSIPMTELEVRTLGEDELEALRLCDVEGLHQVLAGERMGVSRGTVQRLLKSGRAILVAALVDNAAVHVVPGGREEPGAAEDSTNGSIGGSENEAMHTNHG